MSLTLRNDILSRFIKHNIEDRGIKSTIDNEMTKIIETQTLRLKYDWYKALPELRKIRHMYAITVRYPFLLRCPQVTVG